ncbi:hypothetical protein A3SI_03935 [Nitritalea halalkaliphila LW7]|uniref:Uncharacterized protein n=1 Tax=Nitritalea halalkaliphila LW7 TaxID=1189621 RepID=I5C989_9BACT|nr:hypothetical protein [Nitritalea halalkaliphila]EIM78391.1 hypothetical protein A3SI_03935 [Nitritalea halalkaliphila LW7]
MKFFVLLVLVALIGFFAGPFVPHYALMLLIALFAFLLNSGGWAAFMGGGLGLGLLWFGLSTYTAIVTESALPDRMAQLFQLPDPAYLALLTALVGFLLGGFSALTGKTLRSIVSPKPRVKPYR